MRSINKVMMAAATAAILCVMGGCGEQDSQSYSYSKPREGETIETLAVLTDKQPETMPATTASPIHEIALSLETTEVAETTTITTTELIAGTMEAATTTTEPEEFILSHEIVANKMHDFFSKKGYSDAQIAGIIANAEKESDLDPLRFILDSNNRSWFGLFMLMECPRRDEMFAEFDAQGLGKYTSSDYWVQDAKSFDNFDDFNKFMDIFLTYTMNPDDPLWMDEIRNAEAPEEAAEIFLVCYERAFGGEDQIEFYEPFKGRYYQNASGRRAAARRWYNYFTA